jgi:hypothetical protein
VVLGTITALEVLLGPEEEVEPMVPLGAAEDFIQMVPMEVMPMMEFLQQVVEE